LKISKEIKIGAVVLLTLGLFVWGYNFLKGTDLFKSSRDFYVVYSNVNGLSVNNPVEVNGLGVGAVKEIILHPDHSGRIVVKFSITNKEFNFKNKSLVKIISSDLLGTRSIQIFPSEKGEDAMPGDTLPGEVQGSLQDEVNKSILPLKTKAEQLLSSVDSVIVIFQSVFNDQTRDDLRRSFSNIALTITTLSHTTAEFDTLITGQKSRLTSIIGNVDDITSNIKNNSAKLNLIIDNIAMVSDSLAKTNIVGAVKKAENALLNFADITQKIKNGEGTMGMLLNDDSLYNELNASAKSLNTLIVDINENPKRYVHFSIFGRKDKKKDEKKVK
jgi:phospholipid/cholesterol/gamma-HCH transport system substrate-binding protein